MYNGQNLDFTGKANPYGLIQMGGKRKSRRRKPIRKRRRGRGTRKFKR
mgnify:CR=1 FL=1